MLSKTSLCSCLVITLHARVRYSFMYCTLVFIKITLWRGYYKVIEANLIEIYFDYFDIIPIEIITSIRILLIWIEPKYLVYFDANIVHLNRNEKIRFQILSNGWKYFQIELQSKDVIIKFWYLLKSHYFGSYFLKENLRYSLFLFWRFENSFGVATIYHFTGLFTI